MTTNTETPLRAYPRPTFASCRLATPASIKTNGWERFMNWVQEGGIALLAKRITKGYQDIEGSSNPTARYDTVARHPILAAVVPTDWVNKITKKGAAPRADETLIRSSAFTRASFRSLASQVYADAADGYETHIETRSYRKSGTRPADHPNALADNGFTLVSLPWLAQALGKHEKDFYGVNEGLPWITRQR